MTGALNDYSEEYYIALHQYAKSMDVEINSEAQLKYVLQQMQKLYTTWGLYLTELGDNAAIDLPVNELFSPFQKKLNSFSYIKVLMNEEKGSFPELENYFGILQLLESELYPSDEQASFLAKEPSELEKDLEKATVKSQLRESLSSMGRLTLDIFQRNGNSYYLMINEWLDSMKMPKEYRKPFLAPIIGVYRLGLKDLQTQLDESWKLMINKTLIPMSHYLPFDSTAKETLSVDEFTALIGPEGEVWNQFESLLGPFCS